MWRLWSAIIIRKKEDVTPRPRKPSTRWSPRTCSPRWSSGGRRQRWTTTLIIFQLINISPPHVSCLLIYFINLTNCNKHSLPRLHFIKYKAVHFPFLHCIRRLPGSELPCPARRRRRKAKEKHTKPLILLQLAEDWRLEWRNVCTVDIAICGILQEV